MLVLFYELLVVLKQIDPLLVIPTVRSDISTLVYMNDMLV